MKKTKVFIALIGLGAFVIVSFYARRQGEEKKFISVIMRNELFPYQKFLDSYPRSKHAGEIKARIQQIETEEETYKEDTIDSYGDLLRKYPKGRLANYASLRIKYLEHFQNSGTPKTIEIIIEPMEEEIERELKRYSNNLWSDTKEIFEAVGVKVVSANVDKRDSTLHIKVKGKADGATYISKNYAGSAQFLYTGADISGEIVFQTGNKVINKGFSGREDKPDTIAGSSMFDQEGEAPFSSAYLQSNFIPQVLGIVDEVYGLESLVQCFLRFPGDRNMEEAIVNKGSPVVDYLVDYLKDGNLWRVNKVVEVFGKTGNTRAVDYLIPLFLDRELYLDEDDIARARKDSLDRFAYKRPDQEIIIADPVLSQKFSLRFEIIRALGALGDRRAVELLASALEDNFLKNDAAEALSLITKESFLEDEGGQDVSKWQEWWKDNKANYLSGGNKI